MQHFVTTTEMSRNMCAMTRYEMITVSRARNLLNRIGEKSARQEVINIVIDINARNDPRCGIKVDIT